MQEGLPIPALQQCSFELSQIAMISSAVYVSRDELVNLYDDVVKLLFFCILK